MAEKAMIWLTLICIMNIASAQNMTVTQLKGNGICKDNENKTRYILRTLSSVKEELANCVVIVGNLQINLEYTSPEGFIGLQFPNLKEITGFFVMYRVRGLDSIGQLFPNLTRIRGTELLNNYGLIIYDMFNLTEIGLYNLLKIDRGGVIIWDVPQACFVDTINWRMIAPKSRHVIAHLEKQTHCNFPCTCSDHDSLNNCWNNKMCQLYVEGPEKLSCVDQCFGCRKTRRDQCQLCRHYTYQTQCVSQCPENTLVLEHSTYCITSTECKELHGWTFNNTCVFDCPINYVKHKGPDNDTYCFPCATCYQKCGTQYIQTSSAIQMAENCVYINGSLEIHIGVIPDAMEELQRLRHIEEVSDYIIIYSSITIKSLNFLSGLRQIGGRRLKSDRYSFLVQDMENLRTLLPKNVTENLIVNKGYVQIYGNPKLCASEIEKLKVRFPATLDDMDIPKGSNGYGGICNEMVVDIQTRVLNETSAAVLFPISNPDLEYTVLYARVPPKSHHTLVLETCSDYDWLSIDVPVNSTTRFGLVELNKLRPASNYAICIETHDPVHGTLARSNIFNFTTLTGTPEPPFLTELVAESYDTVVLRWLDHKDYRSRITLYQIEVMLVEINKNVFDTIDYCKHVIDDEPLIDYDRHAIVMRPPAEYGKGCESMCGVLSTVPEGALVDEYFDVCDNVNFDCNVKEEPLAENTTFKNYVKSLVLAIDKLPEKGFRVGGLAPYSDYSFKLRACAYDKCSRSVRGVVRTLKSKYADVPTVTFVEAFESGYITVIWKHPELTNGPLLTYSVEVLLNVENNPQAMSQSWCVLANQNKYTLQSSPASNYKVRLCSKTLANSNSCTEWKSITAIKLKYWWWHGLSLGILLFSVSALVGYLRKIRHDNDTQLLIGLENTFIAESDPPAALLNSVPFYSVPLNDNRVNCD